MSIETVVKEAFNKNPLGFEKALKEELRARVALALEAKMIDEENLDEVSKDTVRSYADRAFRQANTILKRSLDDQPKAVQKASAAALERRKKGIKMSGRRLDKGEMQAMADKARDEKY
jgi:hypothetical protein